MPSIRALQPDDDDGDPLERIFVRLADGKERQIKYIAATTDWFEGQQITAQEFMQRLFGDLSALIGGEDELRDKWSDPDLRTHFLSVLEDKGYDHGRLEEMRRLIDAKDSDIFDVLAYVRFSLPPKTLNECADGARASGLSGYETEMRAFLEGVLASYERQGVSELGYNKLGHLLQARYGSTTDASRKLGDMGAIRNAFKAMQKFLYLR